LPASRRLDAFVPIGSLIDSQLGPYRLVDFLGAGGMGEVYRGVDATGSRTVAIKVVTGTRATPALLQRFRNEARIQSTLRHPNIATLLEISEVGGQPCIVMEYVDGETLEERIGRSPLPVKEALQILAAVTEAVGYLHDNHVIHRDLKASNIKITSRGTAKLLDFGLARDRLTPQLTRTGVAIGTLGYMAPEQLKAGTLDTRTDIWALGVILYEMLTGTLPFPRGAVGSKRYTPAGKVAGSIPPGVDAIIARCLEFNPTARYPSAAALQAELKAAETPSRPDDELRRRDVQPPPSRRDAEPPRRPAPAEPPSRRDAWWRNHTIQAGGAVLGFALLVWLGTRLRPDPGPPAPPPAVGNAGRACGVAAANAGETREIRIDVMAGAADVYCGDRRLGRTPFNFPATLGSEVRFTLREEGRLDKPVAFTVSEATRTWTFVMTPRP
jgi:serine/threonine-protein kinase